MKLNSLRDLFIHELKDLYSAEKQLMKALPKMAKAATNEELQMAFEDHIQQTEGQIGRLEQILENLGESTRGEKCAAMEGLIEEGQKLMKEDIKPEILDAALIASAQRIEHYEIAGYGCARTFAELLDEDEAAELLEETLEEEKETDARLTEVAEGLVNIEAEEAESKND